MAIAAKTRRWFRFRLRSLLLVITAVAVPLAWVANERRQSAFEARIADELRELGFEYIVFAGRYDSTEFQFDGKPQTGWRKFARQLLGDRIVDVSPHNPWDQDSSGFVVEPTYPWADVGWALDLSPFARLTCLETADFSNLPVNDLTPLAGLQNLKRIYLDSTRVSNLSPLARLTNLEEISFSNTPVRDVSALANLTRLRRLVANQSLVSDLTPLAKLTRLESLSMCDTPVADLRPLANLTNLRYLYLGDSEPWGLEHIPRQTWGGTFNFDINGRTDVYDTTASMFWGGDNYYYYSYYSCHESLIRDVAPLAALRQLVVLHITSAQVVDISAFSSLKNLTELHLHNTSVSDVSCVAKLPKLQVLQLGGTLVTTPQVVELQTARPSLTIGHNPLR